MFGLYNIFIKVSADHIQAVLGAVVLQVVAVLVGVGLLLYVKAGAGTTLQVSARGLGLAAAAGVAIGLVEILTFFIFSRGIPVAVGNPLIIGGSILVTTGVGVALLREAISPLQLAAIFLIAVGIALLAWDSALKG